MRDARPTFAIDELLAHADWLRRLAAHLVRGGDGDDVVQETWVAALRTPPGRDRAVEPWLAEVLRNFVRRAVRERRARQAREEAWAAPAGAAVTPEELLARAEAQRLLVELVLGLDEPFRATVLLRYFEGQPAAEIARRLEVPAGTVRWRLAEALARLRAALDARERPNRSAWRLLLAPLAAPAARPPAGGLSLTGGLLLAIQKKLLVVLAGLVILGLAGGLWWRGGGPPARVAEAPAGRAGSPPARPPAFLPAVEIPAGAVTPDQSRAGTVEGEVVSGVDGIGIAGAELAFAMGESSVASVTDAKGRFRFAPPEPGTYTLARVSAEGYHAFSPEWGDSPIDFSLRAGERIFGVRLALQPARSCAGFVVDQAGKPVAGARLVHWPVTRGAPPPAGSATSDADGKFEFAAIAGLTIEAHVQGPEGKRVARQQTAYLGGTACSMRLKLGPPRAVSPETITGRVEDAQGKPVADVLVEAWVNPVLRHDAAYGFARALSAADGRFALGPVAGEGYEVSAHVRGREAAGVSEVRAGTRDLVLRIPSAGRLEGQVRRSDGAPVTSFAVIIQQHGGGARRGGQWGVFSRHDGAGRFEVGAIPAGKYRVFVAANNLAPSEEQVVEIGPAPLAPLTFTLGAGGQVRGRVTVRGTGAPIAGAKVGFEGRAGSASSVPLAAQVFTGDDGRFLLTGVPPGRVSMLASAPGHHARIVGGIDLPPGGEHDAGDIDLGVPKPGEPARIELVGIGATLAPRGDIIVVGALTPGGGGEKAGLRPGDSITAIDGVPIGQLGFERAIQSIRGAENTVLVLRVRRGDGESDVPVVRQLIRGP